MRRIPVYPFLIGAFAPISLFAANLGQVHARDLFVPLVLTLVLTALLLGVFTLIQRSSDRAAMVVTALLFWFFTYGQWIKAMWLLCPWVTPQYGMFNQGFVSVALGLMLVVTVAAMSRWIKNPTICTWWMNRIGSFLLACPLAVLLVWRLQLTAPPSGLAALGLDKPAWVVATPGPNRAEHPPDIYLIVLDAHGRGDILRDIYGYDESPFLNHLLKKGFFVADRSTSNYCFTELSMGATLNMRYMDEFRNQPDFALSQVTPVLQRNSVMATLQRFGYSMVAYQSMLDRLSFTQANVYYPSPGDGGLSPFQQLLLDTTALSQLGSGAIRSAVAAHQLDYYHFKRQAINFIFNTGGRTAKLPGPKFVFMHILAPHLPFVFAADGSDPGPAAYGGFADPGLSDVFTRRQYLDGYRQQIAFTDQQTAAMIDKILADSPSPPVIILMGDHGPRAGMNWYSSKDTDLRECTANLTAVYFPHGDRRGLYPSISPVNLFRVVLDDCFDAGLPLLPDRVFFTTGTTMTYEDVTDKVRPKESPPALAEAAQTFSILKSDREAK
jgi:hypothetical protein